MKINELNKGNNKIILMVVCIDEKTSKKGQYLRIGLTDGITKISANKWDTNFDAKIGDVCEFNLDVSEYENNPNYTIKSYGVLPDDAYKKSDFIPTAPIDLDFTYNALISLINTFKNEELKKLVLNIYTERKEEIIKSSAAKAIHHNQIGGLLYHTFRMARTACSLANIYTMVNKDLLLAGILLHDIGKLNELNTNELGQAEYTIEGDLLGHLYIGARYIHDKAIELNIDSHISLALEHIILSHHGLPEYGAVKYPQCLEAMLIHECDMIDSYAYQYEIELPNIEPYSQSNENIYGLNKIKVYNPGI